jgi:exopolyphosphatase/guanosine-5'-triphosphate,3'-diphosphate pyrophosphatase
MFRNTLHRLLLHRTARRIAVIDLGTNSFNMLIADVTGTASRVVQREKEKVQLGLGLTEAAIRTIRHMAETARARGVDEIIVAGTSAVRELDDLRNFVRRVRKETGLRVQVLSGEEEGTHLFRAVRARIDLRGRRAVCLDIGGGSVEVIAGTNDTIERIESLPLGSLRISDQFHLQDRPERGDLDRCREFLEQQIRPAIAGLDAPELLIGTSGTVMALAKLTNGELTVDSIDALFARLCARTSAERMHEFDLDESHGTTIVGGALVLRVFLRELRANSILPCDATLREGLLANVADPARNDLPLRARAVSDLAQLTGCDLAHGRHVARLARRIFDQTARLHHLDDSARELLEHAALVHDAGMHINDRGYQHHTGYIVRNASLRGFSEEEIGVIADVASHHRKKPPSLDEPDVVTRLTAILRIAEALDRSHRQCVDDARITHGFAQINVDCALRSDATAELELARKRARYFSKLFQRSVYFAAA